jgi:hypothetical protein
MPDLLQSPYKLLAAQSNSGPFDLQDLRGAGDCCVLETDFDDGVTHPPISKMKIPTA